MERKEQILQTALSLFSNYGFHAVPTSRIAKEAGVSEGLVFKHYKDKKGLLLAILHRVEEKMEEMMFPVLQESDPEQVIKKLIDSVYGVDSADYDFWRMSFKVKWDQEFYKPEHTKPVIDKCAWAFKKLGVKNSKLEAEMLFQNLEQIAIAILREGLEPQKRFKKHLLIKYLKDLK